MNTVEVWFDHDCFQTWCVTTFDMFGDIVGKTDYYHLKRDAIKWARKDHPNADLKVYTKEGKCQN